MKAGLGSDGKVLRGERILSDIKLRSAESPLLDSCESLTRQSMVQRKSKRGSLQARYTIESVDRPGSVGVPSRRLSVECLFDQPSDPRAIARVEFEEVKRLATEFKMDFAEVKQIADIFYTADDNESGGLGKKELESALARIFDFHVVPAADLEEAWNFMVGFFPGSEKMVDELELVNIDAFFHWYVEVVGKRVVSKGGRRKSALGSVPSLPNLKPSFSPESSPGQSSSDGSTASTNLTLSLSLPRLSEAMTGEPFSPTSPTTPYSPLTPTTPPPLAMPSEQLAALQLRFNRWSHESGVRGILFYPQFIKMMCDIYRIPSPNMIQRKWANSLWKEIDVDNGGSINFESFCDWYVKYFDPVSGQRLHDSDMGQPATYA
jgi:Ca2+-binding EF-hand superfamily protein